MDLFPFSMPLLPQMTPHIQLNSRLARNRRTARLRRERKKKEAEQLTHMRADAVALQNELKEKLSKLSSEEKAKFKVFRDEDNKVPSGCLFCEKGFLMSSSEVALGQNSELVRHYINEHPHDTKSSQSYLGDFLTLVNSPSSLLEHVVSLSQDNIAKSGVTDAANSCSSATLSSEEKRRKRLERNAESARLCRQRKKLYIQRLRLELPVVNRENTLLAQFLRHEEKVKTNDLKDIPKLNGWDTLRRKRSLPPSITTTPMSVPKKPLFMKTKQDNVDFKALLELNATLNSLLAPRNVYAYGSNPNIAPQQQPQKDIFEAAFALTTLAKKS